MYIFGTCFRYIHISLCLFSHMHTNKQPTTQTHTDIQTYILTIALVPPLYIVYEYLYINIHTNRRMCIPVCWQTTMATPTMHGPLGHGDANESLPACVLACLAAFGMNVYLHGLGLDLVMRVPCWFLILVCNAGLQSKINLNCGSRFRLSILVLESHP